MAGLIARLPEPPPAAPSPDSLAAVLAEIAETAAETLELQDVFDRVATAVRRLIPLDNMGVVRILDGRFAVLHATTIPCGKQNSDCSEPTPLEGWSPRLRPRPGPIRRIDDAEAELDPSFPCDASILASGVRSSLWEPFRPAGGFAGGVWMSAFRPRAFTDEHQALVRPIAALLGSAIEHWRIWDLERRRRERLDRLEASLGSLAESLDVREVFARMSRAVQQVLPHDFVVLTELDLRGRTLRIAASAGEADIEVPAEPFRLSDEEISRRAVDYELRRDIASEFAPATEREKLLIASGMRSWLRVPIWTGDEVRGSLGFFARAVARYAEEDVEVAVRIADRVGLMLSQDRKSVV